MKKFMLVSLLIILGGYTSVHGDDKAAAVIAKLKDRSSVYYNTAKYKKAGLTGKKVDLSGVDLSYQDLSGAILSNIDFTNANLNGANLSGAEITNAIFDGADLSSATIKNPKAQLDSKYRFKGAKLVNVDLTTWPRCYDSPDFSDADFTNAKLSLGYYSGAGNSPIFERTYANCKGANFTNANMVWIYTGYSNFTGANFNGANLESVVWSGAKIDGACVYGAKKFRSGYKPWLKGNPIKTKAACLKAGFIITVD